MVDQVHILSDLWQERRYTHFRTQDVGCGTSPNHNNRYALPFQIHNDNHSRPILLCYLWALGGLTLCDKYTTNIKVESRQYRVLGG